MKLLSISFASWLLGVATIVFTFSVVEGERLGSGDIRSATTTSLIVTALMFALAYAPSLSWLRKRLGGCRPALLFPFASAVLINLPAFFIGIAAVGRTLATAEALALIGAFLLMGTVFGVCFIWNYQDRGV